MITDGQIRAARALLNWTQRQLADATGLTERTIRAVEDGKSSNYAVTIKKIVSAFETEGVRFMNSEKGVGVYQLVTGCETYSGPSPALPS
jgi:transcriptional regulator with XRE-family HTH domain